MRIGIGFVCLIAVASAQTTTQNTKETKVGVSLKGIEVTRKHTSTTRTPRRTVRGAVRDVPNIHVLVDNQPVRFSDQGPVMRGGRVLVPLRGVFELMGANVVWHRDTNTVTATRGERMVKLPLNGTTATVGGQTMTLDQPPVVLNGRALVPLRFLGESLGATVDWRAATMTVAIKSGA